MEVKIPSGDATLVVAPTVHLVGGLPMVRAHLMYMPLVLSLPRCVEPPRPFPFARCPRATCTCPLDSSIWRFAPIGRPGANLTPLLPKMIPFYAPEDSPIWACLGQPGLLVDHGELRTTLPLDFGLTRDHAVPRARQRVFGR